MFMSSPFQGSVYSYHCIELYRPSLWWQKVLHQLRSTREETTVSVPIGFWEELYLINYH